MVTWNQALINIGFSNAAANYIRTDQGIQLEDLLDLEDDDIATICQTVRKPGGEITRSNRCIANPGIAVSALAEKRLKIVRFMAVHYAHQINRTLTCDLITNATLSQMA